MNLRQAIADIRILLQQAQAISDRAMMAPVNEVLGTEDPKAASNLLADLETNRSLLETSLYRFSALVDTQLQINDIIGKRYYLVYAGKGEPPMLSLKILDNVSNVEGPWRCNKGGIEQARAMVRFRRNQRGNTWSIHLVEFDPKDNTFLTIDVPDLEEPKDRGVEGYGDLPKQ